MPCVPILALCRDLSSYQLDRLKYRWKGKKARQEGLQNHRNCQLYLENGCHMRVCSLLQVIKHISSGLYVRGLTSTCPPKDCVTSTFLSCIKPWTPCHIHLVPAVTGLATNWEFHRSRVKFDRTIHQMS